MNALCAPNQYSNCHLKQYTVIGPYMKQPTLSDIGRATWCLLHTSTAAYHPSKRASARRFVEALPDMFPCHHCGNDFQVELMAHPLNECDLDSAENFRRWASQRHNNINQKLGKPVFDERHIGQRWGGIM